MGFDFKNEMPIYLQIIEQIKRKIISGEYKPKSKIPSVRDFSLMYEVNPNTVQKALAELEEIKLIYTESTNGKFVTDNENIIERIKKETIKCEINKFFEVMNGFGLNNEQTLKILMEGDYVDFRN